MRTIIDKSLDTVHTHTHTLCLSINKIKEIIQTKRIFISILMLVMVAIVFSIVNYYQYFDVQNSIEMKVGKVEYANSAIYNGVKYINKNDTVILNLKGTDTNYLNNSLIIGKIVVKVGGTEITPITKTLSVPTNIANGVEYNLTLSGITGNGELSIEILEGTLKDKASNTNVLIKKNTGIMVDNQSPSTTIPIISNIKVDSMVINTTVGDTGSGLSKIEWYYKKSTESSYKKLESNYTSTTEKQTKTIQLTNLSSGTTYQIYTVTYDALGNKIQSDIVTATTIIAVAKIESKEYAKLQEAVDVQNNSTIVMLQNTTENISISSDKTIVLDLNNKTINTKMINNGNITVNGSGVISDSTETVIENHGTLNISGGTIQKKYKYGKPIINYGTITMTEGNITRDIDGWTFENQGTFNFKGGSINLNATGGGTALYNTSGTINMSGGTISSKAYGLVIDGGIGKTTGGEITASSINCALLVRNTGKGEFIRTTITQLGSGSAVINETSDYSKCVIRNSNGNNGYTFGIKGRVGGKVIATTNYGARGVIMESVCVYNSGYRNVFFPTWTTHNGQDDLEWIQGQWDNYSNPTQSSALIEINKHNNERGEYMVHIYGANDSWQADKYLTHIILNF